MRLIDADALGEMVQTGLRSNPHEDRRARAIHQAEYIHFLGIIRRAPTITTPPNDPLTPEQLQEMDGDPVYLDAGDGGEWVLVRLKGYDVWFTHQNTICAPAKIAFDLGVEVYRCKPTSRPAKGGPACDAEGLHEGRTDLCD